MLFNLELPGLGRLIENSLREDVGRGDLTTLSIVSPEARARGIIYAKETGVIAGLSVVKSVFQYLSPSMEFKSFVPDGVTVRDGTVLAEVNGSARAILTGERLALNFLQHLSGIASKTREFVNKVKDLRVSIVDTRKTTPGLRELEKYAVRAGGGCNHRFALYDAVLIKDNHIKMAGGITEAVGHAKKYISPLTKIEVEVEDIQQLKVALEAGADIIMLDNMSCEMMREAVLLVDKRVLLEASGGVNEGNVRDIAETGVDMISVGALTHAVRSLDISLDINEIKKRRGRN
ncbi:MAG TPA: carboxylating nicotinate-nucleotide diphosphorylase [Clostridia bacterium]|nr:carboxylating nicotinate-nucleotide diphosphorylase [Clostridia bacterium]